MAKRNSRQQGVSLLFFQLLFWSSFVWILLLSITLTLTLRFALDTLENQIEAQLQATATSLASSDMVKQALAQGECSPQLISYLDELVARSADLDVITIAGEDTIRLYHVVHSRIGQAFVGGDEAPALAGRAYFSDAEGTMGMQHRYFCPVQAQDGTVAGFVMASATMDQMDSLGNEIRQTYLHLAFGLAVATLLLSGFITLFIRRLLHGFSLTGLLHTYLTQNDALNDLDEGIVATDSKGCIQLVNRAAQQMLGQSAELLEGAQLDELIRTDTGRSLLAQREKNAPTNRPNVLASSVPQAGKGATLVLIDKSETIRNAEQLSGTRHIVSALRANNHEFMNRLQVISGLLQMGRTQEALDYIDKISTVHAQAIAPVLQHIQNPNVAALLLGKLGNVRELDIQLTLLPNSDLPKHSAYLATGELVTVVGNLLENAIEAVNALALPEDEEAQRNIVLQITEDEHGLLIMVSDTGAGIPPQVLPHIYESGFSTKADEGRGVGMPLIRAIVDRHQGAIEVESEPGAGTTFTLIFSHKRKEALS